MQTICIAPLSTPLTVTQAVLRRIATADRLFLLSARHPCAKPVLEAGVPFTALDDLFETAADFDALAASVAARLLAAGDCTLAQWMAACSAVLQYGGRLCAVFPAFRFLELCDAMRLAHVEPKRVRFVCAGVQKPPRLVLLEGRKRGKPGLHIEPLLITHDERGLSPGRCGGSTAKRCERRHSLKRLRFSCAQRMASRKEARANTSDTGESISR